MLILRKIIKKHNNCVKIFNKADQNGDVCSFALAFILWKMECENKNAFWQINSYRSISQSFDFKFLSGEFSIFPFGVYMSYLDYILNRDKEFNFLECNISSINYIVNRTISFLLIERFIKWLEVVLDPKKYKRIYPDDNIPMYIATIPHNADGDISFYFQKDRYNYMKNILNEINEKYICPYKRSTKYPRYRSPMQIAIDRMENRFHQI
ncbi:hypothetical protein P9E76_14170 [Schinkia azotoformans]|uniref:Uncharacterized protein n=1 Tax=Schinkia azotoformans LMG 9581 TaxID=1131731 RepID=K6D946_SCHAZ|nr:hypothetical protein [Schinkia azotoformans]EKN69027.1 hypothetical protein BAZO_02147 [Schinkia azotoformans LMG 9581]MEC1638380.1 hypothetical protein [Schinkia azotoformans]MEC1946186.1 hypothetical protein [Schinkia azotoformans]